MYFNAEDILPEDLLDAIQEHVQGVEIYIPKRADARLGWGERNGTKEYIAKRNKEIVLKFRRGESIHSLMQRYHLGYDSIRKIVSAHRKG